MKSTASELGLRALKLRYERFVQNKRIDKRWVSDQLYRRFINVSSVFCLCYEIYFISPLTVVQSVPSLLYIHWGINCVEVWLFNRSVKIKSVNCFSSARQKKFPRPINQLTILLICRFSSRLQNSPYFCVFKYARAVKQNVWNEAENRERDWGGTLKIRTVRFAYVIFVRIIRFSKPRAIPSG